MITNKIKSLLALHGLSFAKYANELGITRQSLNNKSNANAYKIVDLIILGKLTNTKLAFIDQDNKPIIIFDNEDIKD